MPFDTTAHSVSFQEPVPARRQSAPAAPVAIPTGLAQPPPPTLSPGHPPDQRGSRGEHLLQCAYGTEDRAARFYADQVADRLLPAMIEFVGRMELAFVATSDGHGDCDSSLRAGPPGFIHVLDPKHLAYPEYRGNGVHASLGNISENPHVGILMVDFVLGRIGLHVNGRARIVDDEELRALHPGLPVDAAPGRRAERWVVVAVDEAYVHCRKHIPRMAPVTDRRDWGTDDAGRKGGDYFGAKADGAGSSGPDAGPTEDRTWSYSGWVPPEPYRRPFPSTTHLPAGNATSRPLRSALRRRVPGVQPPRRKIRWLSS